MPGIIGIDRGPQYVYCGALGFPIVKGLNIMGKGDKRTLRGKIFKGSYGKTRPHHPKKKPAAKRAGKKS
jgi:30S ribosomal protein S31